METKEELLTQETLEIIKINGTFINPPPSVAIFSHPATLATFTA
jgi:hypothetical protein